MFVEILSSTDSEDLAKKINERTKALLFERHTVEVQYVSPSHPSRIGDLALFSVMIIAKKPNDSF